MNEKKPVRSPFFYVGDKYKLMPQLGELFPEKISTYVEPFVGGGSSFLNTSADRFMLNDSNSYVVDLHKFLKGFSNSHEDLFELLFQLIDYYKLSCSYRNITVPEELKKKFVKTYYSHYNKGGYTQMRADYNRNNGDFARLYLLLIYGFNHMIRFNSSGLFNLPVGNVDFNKNVYRALCDYIEFSKQNQTEFSNCDFETFIEKLCIDKDSFVYLDPPYLISNSEYNKDWTEHDEKRLYRVLTSLDSKGIKFGISNLLHHKGKTNKYLAEWSTNYKIYKVRSNYISFNDNSVKSDSEEIYVTNHGKE